MGKIIQHYLYYLCYLKSLVNRNILAQYWIPSSATRLSTALPFGLAVLPQAFPVEAPMVANAIKTSMN